MKNILGVIPARIGSTRFPGKMLADLCGKSMIQHVYEGASKARTLSDLLVACDDEKILNTVQGFGGKACLTSKSHPSGTDRVAEVAAQFQCDFVVNIQGDEPLVKGSMIDLVVEGLLEGKAPVSTVARVATGEDDFKNPNVVKVVCDHQGSALYFSRSPIPYPRDGNTGLPWLKHLGLYGYRRDFLLELTKIASTPLELTERLEQLRILETGKEIRVMICKEDSIGVDTPEDLVRVSHQLRG